MTAFFFVLSTIMLLQSRTLAIIGWRLGIPMTIGWAVGNAIGWYFFP